MESPGKYTKSFVQKMERKIISWRKSLTYLKTIRRKKNAEKPQETDEDYGAVQSLIDEEEISRRKAKFLHDVKKSKKDMLKLTEKTKIKQILRCGLKSERKE